MRPIQNLIILEKRKIFTILFSYFHLFFLTAMSPKCLLSPNIQSRSHTLKSMYCYNFMTNSLSVPQLSMFKDISFQDEVWWFLSLRIFGLLSSSLLLFPQRFGRYVLRPSSGVCCLNFWDEAWWFLSWRIFRLLSSSLLLFPQRFGRYVLRPSSNVWRTREPSRNFELRPFYWIHGGRLFWFC